MRPIFNLSIRTKLSAIIALVFAAVVVLGMINISQLRSMNEFATSLTDVWVPEYEMLGRIQRAAATYHQLVARHLETVDPRKLREIDGDMDSARRTIETDGAAYFAIADDSEERLLYSEFVGEWTTYVALTQGVGQLVAAGADLDLAKEELDDIYGRADAVIGGLFGVSRREGVEAAEYAHDIYAAYSALTLLVIALAAAMTGGALFIIGRNIGKPILAISDAMRRLVAGDATAAVFDAPDRTDEIGTLTAAVGGYRQTLLHSRELAGAAERERARLEAAVSNMPLGLVMFDSDKRLIVANQRYADMYSLPAELTRQGTPWEDLVRHWASIDGYFGADREERSRGLTAVADFDEPIAAIHELADGRTINIRHQPIEGGGWVAVSEDLTERRAIEARLHHMARYDVLTGLPNRVWLAERLDELLGGKTPQRVALLLLNLERFRSVNDALGHHAGDKLLCAVAHRLKFIVGESGAVVRLGGDEFGVVQVAADELHGVRDLAGCIAEELSSPYEIDGRQIVVGAKIGIALSPGDGADAERLLRNGNIALGSAKQGGNGSYRFFEPSMDANRLQRHTLESDLHMAVGRNEFELHYQPQVNLGTNRITGFEALLRWRHPERGLIAPDDFIPIAEETGLIVPIGEWVLNQACRDAARWPRDVKVAVNLSPVQFGSPRLLQSVVSALSASNLTPNRLELEVTENVLLADTETTLALLNQLHALGVEIAMDDFGTGYSSLSYFQMFRFDRIKIDRRFVRGLSKDKNSLAIIMAIASLGTAMGIVTTAEGVETEEQLDRVRAAGCTEVQGFVTGEPMSFDAATALLVRPTGKTATA